MFEGVIGKIEEEQNGNVIKDCSLCTFPHEAENYDLIIKHLSK